VAKSVWLGCSEAYLLITASHLGANLSYFPPGFNVLHALGYFHVSHFPQPHYLYISLQG